MFELIKKMFVGLLTSIVHESNHTKYVSLNTQKCMIQLTLINLHPNGRITVKNYIAIHLRLN